MCWAADALAAVGSAYTLMTFLTSIFLGLSMGAGALYAICQGSGQSRQLRQGVFHGLVLILLTTLAVSGVVYGGLGAILAFLQVPEELKGLMGEYLVVIFGGLLATSLYNFFACLLRAGGKFHSAAGLSCGIGGYEYRAGSVVCDRAFSGDSRCGHCHGSEPICVRRGDYSICLPALPGAAASAVRAAAATGMFRRSSACQR